MSRKATVRKPNLQKPRSRAAHDKVLEAAIELFATHGIEGTSIDAIAASSGVSKATIYKHWADKDALCLEAICRVHGLDREPVRFESDDLLQDIIDFLKHKPPDEMAKLRDRVMPHVAAYAARNRQFGLMWRTRVLEPGRATVIEFMQRGIREGYFPRDLNADLGIALLIGPMMYAHIFGAIVRVPETLPEDVAMAFWRAFAGTD